MRYHINFEGKIYPCKAKMRKCHYSEERHANSEVELYYKLISLHGLDVQPSKMAMQEIQRTNRVKSLYSMSELISKSDCPIEVIVSTLNKALKTLEDPVVKKEIEYWKQFEENCIEDVRRAKLNGIMKFPYYIPENLLMSGRRRWSEIDRQKVLEDNFKSEEERRRKAIMGRLEGRRREYPEYVKMDTKKLNHKNYDNTYKWIKYDFEKFSQVFNVSKIITQPMFYGSMKLAIKTIKEMDDYELLSTYDDFSLTANEIETAVKKVNYFKFEYRKDLTESANKNLENWYTRNQEIYSKWKMNPFKRVLIHMEIAEELDRRRIKRQDLILEEILKEVL